MSQWNNHLKDYMNKHHVSLKTAMKAKKPIIIHQHQQLMVEKGMQKVDI